MKPNKAVVAVDRTDTDEHTLRYMNFWNALMPLDALSVLHVLPKFDVFDALFHKNIQALSGIAEQKKMVHEELVITTHNVLSTSLDKIFNLKVLNGNILTALLEELDDIKADLLVLGRKSSFSNYGTLSRSLIRYGSCNTLIVPEGNSHKLNQLLVPIDFSKNSIRALAKALHIARLVPNKLKVKCLHIYDISHPNDIRNSTNSEEYRRGISLAISKAFNDLKNNYPYEQLDCVELSGQKADLTSIILDYSTQCDADLIVMGAKGHSSINQYFMGSVAEKMMSKSWKCPILFIK